MYAAIPPSADEEWDRVGKTFEMTATLYPEEAIS